MANGRYNTAKYKLANGALNLATADLRVLLVNDTYVFNADHDFVADVVATELSGPGYTRVALTTLVLSQNDTDDRAELDCDDIAYTNIDAGTIGAAIVFVQVTTDADSYLVGYFDEGGFPFVTSGGNVTLQINTAGLFHVT